MNTLQQFEEPWASLWGAVIHINIVATSKGGPTSIEACPGRQMFGCRDDVVGHVGSRLAVVALLRGAGGGAAMEKELTHTKLK